MLPLDYKVKSLIAGALIAGSVGLMVYFLPKKDAISHGLLTKIKKKQRSAGTILKKIASKKGRNNSTSSILTIAVSYPMSFPFSCTIGVDMIRLCHIHFTSEALPYYCRTSHVS